MKEDTEYYNGKDNLTQDIFIYGMDGVGQHNGRTPMPGTVGGAVGIT